MGIVSWASLKCEILPRIHNLFLITSSKLEALLEATYAILRIRFGDELLILNNTLLASLLEREPASIQALASQLPGWSLLVGIAGRDRLPEERVAYQEKDLSELGQHYGLELLPAVPGANGTEVLKIILNPSSDPYWKTALRGSCQEIFFLNTLDHAPDFIQTMYSAAQVFGYPTPDIGVYIQPVHQGASCHIEFDLPFNRASPRELERMQQVYTRASEELFKRGAYYSRPYGLWASLAFNRDAQTTAALKKIKGIFDPNNILNPGKLCF
jgi:FAD/FMN-containing dehydrogenase